MNKLSARLTLPRLTCVAALATAVTACGGSGGDNTPAITTPVATPPAAPAAPTLAARLAARIHYFGAENVDPTTGEVRKDLLILSWATNNTYAAAINGKVVLLDASLLRREETVGRTPTSLTEMVNLTPSYIFIGKAAPGHIDLAANIAFRTSATVVGAQEHCDAVEEDARRQQNWTGAQKLIKCTAAVAKDQAVGDKINVTDLSADLGVCVRAVKHTDRLVAIADSTLPAQSFNWGGDSDVRDAVYWPLGIPAQDGVTTSAGTSGPSVLYHFTFPGGRNFGFVWNDRVGSLKQTPAVATLLRALPKTDLQVGSVDASNASTSGLIDPALYIQAMQPKIFFPAGHDAASQRAGAFNIAELMKRSLETALASMKVTTGLAGTQLRINFDPSDYVKPHFMTFDPAVAAWQRAGDRASATSCN